MTSPLYNTHREVSAQALDLAGLADRLDIVSRKVNANLGAIEELADHTHTTRNITNQNTVFMILSIGLAVAALAISLTR